MADGIYYGNGVHFLGGRRSEAYNDKIGYWGANAEGLGPSICVVARKDGSSQEVLGSSDDHLIFNS